MDIDYANAQEAREARHKNRVLQAQWFGGDVQFGKAGEPGSYVKHFDGMRPISREIEMKWQDGEPANGDVAVCQAIIGGETWEHIIEPEWMDGDKPRRRLAKDYKGMAEKWALWRWHTIRGTPVTERDAYLLEPNFEPPTFVWKRNPGRPPKTE